MSLTGMLVVVPSRVGVNEPFAIKVKLRGELRELVSHAAWNTPKPSLHGPFNLNVQRGIQYLDDCPPQWSGKLTVEADGLRGPDALVFDGTKQGAFPGDTRPIGVFDGFAFERPGVHFIQVTDPESGLTVSSNPMQVTAQPPTERIWWGDPHFHTCFSDAIRCPEELYAFARDEAFLDFAAMTDHMEALTDPMWQYFQTVTDGYNAPGRFATLHAQEWTNSRQDRGAPGHRNIYFRGESGRALRCTDDDCDTLEKFWARLDEMSDFELLTIPHHCSNHVMGIDWDQGWNPKYDKAIEVYSVWGNSEKPAAAGNPRPIRAAGGEVPGRHWVDAFVRGFRGGFVGGGDVHDGRPGDELHTQQPNMADYRKHLWPQGFTAAIAESLSRESIFDAMATRRTYATTRRRILLDVQPHAEGWRVLAAAEDGVDRLTVVQDGKDVAHYQPDADPRVLRTDLPAEMLGGNAFCYLRVVTRDGHLAWMYP